MANSLETSSKISSVNSAKAIFILALYCVSGTLLTLLNKFAVVIFPYTNVLLVLQNGLAVLLLVLATRCFRQTFGPLPLLNLTILQLWMPLVLLFVLMLTSSLSALKYVSVPTVIVMRNLTTLFIVILEYVLLNHKIHGLSAATLLCILLGAILYAKHDLTFNIPGYALLTVNIIATSFYQVYVKKIIHSSVLEDVGSIGMSYYNNLISLPVLFIFAGTMGELTTLSSNFNLKYLLQIKPIVLIFFSGILGFSLSISAFALNRLISATSMMVANNVNKFSIIILSEIFIQSTLDTTASIGAVSVLVFGWMYSQTVKSLSKRLFLIMVVIFTVVSVGFACNHINIIKYHSHFGSINKINSFSNNVSPKEDQMIIAMKKTKGDAIYHLHLPSSEISKAARRRSPAILVMPTKKFRLPKSCVNKNSSIWKICPATRCIPYNGNMHWQYPRTTNSGENTGEFINRVLEIAWGSNPPSVDLYLRSGCNGIMEMKYLFESIEIFWPRFLGSIIIVLDSGDEVIVESLLPVKPTHHYVIAFEQTPCVSGRIFNQYSYLNLDRHSSADYVVTIDSDCIFHSPVTPDLLFRQGRIILGSSRTFQREYWLKPVDFMLGDGMYDGHYMVTQPVTFSRSTFFSFRLWFQKTKNKCYEDQLSQLSPDNYLWFCWMCQIGTYLERGNSDYYEHKKYWFQHLDNNTLEPMLRFAIHVTYESYDSKQCEKPECYEKSANRIVKQGLCRAFGSSIFHFCSNYADSNYINNVTFLYAHTNIQAANQSARINAITSYLQRLFNVTMIALHG